VSDESEVKSGVRVSFEMELELMLDERGLFDEVAFARSVMLALIIEGHDSPEFDEFCECAVEMSDEPFHALDVGWSEEKEFFHILRHSNPR
jgi:hypothetical protein